MNRVPCSMHFCSSLARNLENDASPIAFANLWLRIIPFVLRSSTHTATWFLLTISAVVFSMVSFLWCLIFSWQLASFFIAFLLFEEPCSFLATLLWRPLSLLSLFARCLLF